jgi:hypothetical protein
VDARLGVLSGGLSGEEGSWVEFLCGGGALQFESDRSGYVIAALYALNTVMDRTGYLYRTKPIET